MRPLQSLTDKIKVSVCPHEPIDPNQTRMRRELCQESRLPQQASSNKRMMRVKWCMFESKVLRTRSNSVHGGELASPQDPAVRTGYVRVICDASGQQCIGRRRERRLCRRLDVSKQQRLLTHKCLPVAVRLGLVIHPERTRAWGSYLFLRLRGHYSIMSVDV